MSNRKDKLGKIQVRADDNTTPPVGTWSKVVSLENLELLGDANFDFAVIDTEHALINRESIYAMTVVGQAAGLRMLIRVPDGLHSDVQAILDAGIDGLLIPRVTDVEIATKVISGLRFPPHGERGMGITSRAGRWGGRNSNEYVATGQHVDIILQLESLESLKNAADFAAIEGVTGLFVGLGDLSLSSGLTPADEEFQEALKTAVEAAHNAGLPIGTAAGQVQAISRLKRYGFDYYMVSNDAGMFAKAANEVSNDFHKIFEEGK